jgi:hypothetical protein
MARRLFELLKCNGINETVHGLRTIFEIEREGKLGGIVTRGLEKFRVWKSYDFRLGSGGGFWRSRQIGH